MTDNRISQEEKGGVRGKARSALDHTQERASETYRNARQRTRDAAHRAEEGIEGNPLAVLAGGAALGMLAGVLIPTSNRERQALGPIGKRLAEGATAAAVAARDAGKEELSALAPDKSAAKNKASDIVGNIARAASEAGRSAAGKSA